MQQRRVREEGFRFVNLCHSVTKMTVAEEEAPANYVPAAAVIRREQALSGITGCKGCVGGDCKSGVKTVGSTDSLHLKLWSLE